MKQGCIFQTFNIGITGISFFLYMFVHVSVCMYDIFGILKAFWWSLDSGKAMLYINFFFICNLFVYNYFAVFCRYDLPVFVTVGELVMRWMLQEHRTSQLPLDLDTGEDDSTSLKSDTDIKSKHCFRGSWKFLKVKCKVKACYVHNNIDSLRHSERRVEFQ
jgi:hypothetical protein